jgi:trk system potassium uptake protein TrkA
MEDDMRIIIVGCGRMGSELALQMLHDGHDVTVVDNDPSTFYRLGPGFKGKTVEGVGFDRDVLVRAGAEHADALAAVTSGDNRNIVIARVARNVFRIPKVVARLYDPRRAEIYQRLGLQTVSSTAWGASRIIQLLAHRDLNVISTLGNGEVELVELEAPPHWVSRAVNNVNVPGEISVITVSRKDKTLVPTLGTVFQEGDRLVIAVLATSRSRLEDLLALG